jgi:hypothetical protein
VQALLGAGVALTLAQKIAILGQAKAEEPDDAAIARRILAENLRNDDRLSATRRDRFHGEWVARSPEGAYRTYRLRLEQRVEQCRDPEFADPGWGSERAPFAYGQEYRQFLNLSRIVAEHPAWGLDSPAGTPPAPSEAEPGDAKRGTGWFTAWWDDIVLKRGREPLRRLFEHIVERAAMSPEAVRHPSWLTPLREADPAEPPDVEEQLAAAGVAALDAWWLEFRFEGFDLSDNRGVVPVVLDGRDRYWHSSFRPGTLPKWGYSVDLRAAPRPGERCLPEVIVRSNPDLWPQAWRNANCRFYRSRDKCWRTLCGFEDGSSAWDTLQDRRKRHRAWLARGL